MLDKATYLVDKTIAEKSGLVGSRYIVADGRYVLNNRDLDRVVLTEEERSGLTRVTTAEAKTLIRQNNYKLKE